MYHIWFNYSFDLLHTKKLLYQFQVQKVYNFSIQDFVYNDHNIVKITTYLYVLVKSSIYTALENCIAIVYMKIRIIIHFCVLLSFFVLKYHFRMLLKHCFEQLRSTQIAIVHCSAQTNPTHVLQKLGQTCMVLNTNTGRVYRPKDCERLVLYLKDINLPKPDKWGTCQLIAFLQQVIEHFS